MTTSSAWIGVDVSKKFLDVASTTRALARVANDADGRLALALRLKAEGVSGVIVEATGGIERALVAALTAEHVPASIVNPARVRKFAEGAASSPRRIAWMPRCSPATAPTCSRRRPCWPTSTARTCVSS